MNALQPYRVEPFCQPSRKTNWYAVCTRSRFEKKVYAQLAKQQIEAYLPLQTTIRQWSDRRKKVEVPFFTGYVFVCITLKESFTVLNLEGVVRYICFGGKAVPIPEKQIRLIRNLLGQELEATEFINHPPKGSKVLIKAGPLIGLSGQLVQYAGKKRVIIGIEEIGKTVMVNIPLPFLALVV